jgi:hypothetical protein
MEPTLSLDVQALKALIKESVREVTREEWFKFFDLLTLPSSLGKYLCKRCR